jgi:hypothetical protein
MTTPDPTTPPRTAEEYRKMAEAMETRAAFATETDELAAALLKAIAAVRDLAGRVERAEKALADERAATRAAFEAVAAALGGGGEGAKKA